MIYVSDHSDSSQVDVMSLKSFIRVILAIFVAVGQLIGFSDIF